MTYEQSAFRQVIALLLSRLSLCRRLVSWSRYCGVLTLGSVSSAKNSKDGDVLRLEITSLDYDFSRKCCPFSEPKVKTRQ